MDPLPNIQWTVTGVKNLIESGTDIDMKYDPGYWTANKITLLHHAATTGNITVVSYLVGAGANFNILDQRGATPLVTAINSTSADGDYDIVKILMEAGADPNIPNNHGLTPLHCAVGMRNMQIAKYLIENGADSSLNTPDNTGVTPLIYASFCPSEDPTVIDMAKYLLDNGADKDYKCKEGLTASERANKWHNPQLAQFIESYEPVPVMPAVINSNNKIQINIIL